MNKNTTQSKVFIKMLALLISAFFVSGTLFAQTYCTPTNNTNGAIYYISNVTTTGGSTNINNSSVTTSPDGYSDYTSMNVTVPSGGSFSLAATAYMFTYKWAIWIDWNHDGDFDDVDETVYTFLQTTGVESINTSITVPVTALPGDTRMRIRLLRDWATEELTPCALDLWGEVEDYTVIVGSTVDCDGPPTAGIISASATDVTCGETVNLNLSGSTIASGITYQWQYNTSGAWTDFGSSSISQTSPSITGITQFRCVISCTNSGESATTDVITVNTVSPVADLGNDMMLCSLESAVTLDAGENPGATFLWNTGATTQTIDVTDPGTYSVTVTLGTCTATDEVTVSEGALPTVAGISAVGIPPSSFSFTANNPQNVTGYSWDFGDGIGTSTLPNPEYAYTPGTTTQTYTVTLIVTNDCGADTVTTIVTVEPGSGIHEANVLAGALKLFPNPAGQTVTLQNESGYKMQYITITNMLGQQLLTVPVEQNDRQTINLSGLSSGLYQVIVGFEQGNAVKKLEIIR